MKPIVAIVGRPNVGKSTLFNRLIGRRKAITSNEPGVTRDLNFSDCEDRGRFFTLVDTGGFEPEAREGLLAEVRTQAQLAIEDADVIVFLMDGRTGPTPDDTEIVNLLRRSGKPVIYAANKIDTARRSVDAAAFYTLGMDTVIAVSAEHGIGIDELGDAICSSLDALVAAGSISLEEEGAGERISVCIVGRPNVGKSSILNRLIGRQRTIVSEKAGTTRDAIDTRFDHETGGYLFIDTAGIRKKARISTRVEVYSSMAAIRTIERSDVALFVLDASAGVRTQDEKIGALVEGRGKGCVVVVNKWDLVEKETNTAARFTEELRSMMQDLSYAPVIYISALTGQRVVKVFDTVRDVYGQCGKRISTARLNTVLRDIVARHRPPIYRGREVKFYYMTQTGSNPPRFVIFSNYPHAVADSYKRYLVNSFREPLGLEQSPLRISLRKRH